MSKADYPYRPLYHLQPALIFWQVQQALGQEVHLRSALALPQYRQQLGQHQQPIAMASLQYRLWYR
jgi:hypothetical protein